MKGGERSREEQREAERSRDEVKGAERSREEHPSAFQKITSAALWLLRGR